MNYKEETLNIYEKFSEHFNKKFEEYKNKFIKDKMEKVNSLIPTNSKILDVGSGPGNHATFFKEKGHEVLCLDISEKFLDICKQKGLETINMDFENLELPENSFDLVWVYTSLLHIPKQKIPEVIERIKQTIKSNGFFLISLKKGTEEGFVNFKEKGRRWFSHHTREEIEALLRGFKILDSWEVETENNKVFIDYLCQKN